MKKQLLSLILITGPAVGFSQVTLNASMAPSVNSIFTYYDANTPSPPFVFGKAGTSNTWDFTGLTASPSDEDTTFVVAPSSVPMSASFPSATHTTYEGGDPSYTMLHIDAAGIQYLGAVSDPAGSGNYLPLVLNTPLTSMAFPYTYGNTAMATGYFEVYTTGAAAGQPTVDSVHYKSNITGQRDVIAGGNMIIPSGTFPAILERSINYSVDSLWIKGSITAGQWVISPGFPQTNLDSAFYWYTSQSLLPYAHALYDNTGLHDVNYFKAMSSTGISETAAAGAVKLYPNPAEETVHLNLPAAKGNYSVNIYSMNGAVAYHINTDLPTLNISKLTKGLYVVEVSNENGFLYTTRLVKN
jgi:hypothetical protein